MIVAAAPEVVTSPFKGLTPFEDFDLDAVLFFGREREREVIAANLLASRLTVLYGASGVGKSSVLRAGVAHHLRGLAKRNLETRGHRVRGRRVRLVDAGSVRQPPGRGRSRARDVSARPGDRRTRHRADRHSP